MCCIQEVASFLPPPGARSINEKHQRSLHTDDIHNNVVDVFAASTLIILAMSTANT